MQDGQGHRGKAASARAPEGRTLKEVYESFVFDVVSFKLQAFVRPMTSHSKVFCFFLFRFTFSQGGFSLRLSGDG